MKNKIIAIVVTVVFIAGAGTAIGVTVDRQHSEETASLVNEAVLKALETTTTTTTATSTTTTAATITTTAPAATKKTTTTTEAQTIMNTTIEKHKNLQSNNLDLHDATTTLKKSQENSSNITNSYSQKFYKVAIINEELFNVYITNNGEYVYFKNNNEKETDKVLIKNINDVNFVFYKPVKKKQYDKNKEPYWEVQELFYTMSDEFPPVCLDQNGSTFYFDDDGNRIYYKN